MKSVNRFLLLSLLLVCFSGALNVTVKHLYPTPEPVVPPSEACVIASENAQRYALVLEESFELNSEAKEQFFSTAFEYAKGSPAARAKAAEALEAYRASQDRLNPRLSFASALAFNSRLNCNVLLSSNSVCTEGLNDLDRMVSLYREASLLASDYASMTNHLSLTYRNDSNGEISLLANDALEARKKSESLSSSLVWVRSQFSSHQKKCLAYSPLAQPSVTA